VAPCPTDSASTMQFFCQTGGSSRESWRVCAVEDGFVQAMLEGVAGALTEMRCVVGWAAMRARLDQAGGRSDGTVGSSLPLLGAVNAAWLPGLTPKGAATDGIAST
jgi:hypothetical protein